MPGCSGLDLLDAIHARRPSLPVVLVTGAGTYENLTQALSRGASGLVTNWSNGGRAIMFANYQGALSRIDGPWRIARLTAPSSIWPRR